MSTCTLAVPSNVGQSSGITRDAPGAAYVAHPGTVPDVTATRPFGATIVFLQEGFAEYEAMNWRIKTTLQSLLPPAEGIAQRRTECAGSAPVELRRLAFASEFGLLMAGVEQAVSRASALQMQLITAASLAIFDSRQRLSDALDGEGRCDPYPSSEKTRLAQVAMHACAIETEQLTLYIERGVEALTALARSTGNRVLDALSLH